MTDAYLPIEVCGVSLAHIQVTQQGEQGSALEDLCADTRVRAGGPNRRTGDPNFQVFIAQLAAAKLNVAATLDEEGRCDDTLAAALQNSGCDFGSLEGIEDAMCDRTGSALSACIAALDAFNNSQDGPSFANNLPEPFITYRRAEPNACTQAIRNGFVNQR